MTKNSKPIEPDPDPDENVARVPATALGPEDVACPACGAPAHRPGLRHQCSACGVRFDVARVDAGSRQPAQSGPLLEPRLGEPCPVSTIEDRSDAEHVRWLVIRRNGRRGIDKVITAIAVWLALNSLFWGAALTESSIGSAIAGLVALVVSVLWIRAAILEYLRREELILDRTGLTQVCRIGSRVTKFLVPLHLIRFFQVDCVGIYQGGDNYVIVYHARGDVRMASFLGYRYASTYKWLIRQLATGCALLLDTDPEQFLVRDVECPDESPLGRDTTGVDSNEKASGDEDAKAS